MPWSDIVEYKPTIGWMPRPNLNTHYVSRDEDICKLQTDSQGWTGTRTIGESDVVVFGDSYAFGYGVDSKNSFSEQCRNPRIKAIGAPGYNMVQELLLIRQFSCALEGKLVVWFICFDNDLYDNLTPNKPNFYKTPFVRSLNGTGEWEIVTRHVAAAKRYLSLDGSPYDAMLAKFCTRGFFSERAYSACSFLIREAKDTCTKAGAGLAVITIPNKNQLTEPGLEYLISLLPRGMAPDPDYPDKRIAKICRQLGVPFAAGKSYLEISDYKERDTHWNEKGHRRIAELLGTLYREHLSRHSGLRKIPVGSRAE
jgi:hypothetical protein